MRRTYVDVALDVCEEDETAGASVADVGVDGEVAVGVARDAIGERAGSGVGHIGDFGGGGHDCSGVGL